MHSATIVRVLITLAKEGPEKISLFKKHLVTVIDHTPTITHNHRDRSDFITDASMGTTLTGQDHTIDLNMTEAQVTTGDMHTALYHTLAVAHDTHPQTDTLEGTLAGTPHTITDIINS